ncbi:MAG: hypothetical protein IJ764_06845 [Bacteroidales bacterium]|nr:hypothetical protein [Bacteroidales bacterium]
MKRLLFILFVVILLSAACKKKVDEIEFAGTVVDCRECTGTGTTSLSEMDWGWVIALQYPDSMGVDYTNSEGQRFKNVVVMYGTGSLPKQNQKVSGKLYRDENYANSYCRIRFKDLPQTVCSKLN